ncbi:MAG: GNAT family N-acetyltransferase [Armatimonadota bacterium]|nr:GNAT family N-acetyltransferase [Armatimonadota bacterium]
MRMGDGLQVEVRPVTQGTWRALEALFRAERGLPRGCWCMWWRTSRDEFQRLGPRGRRLALRRLVVSGTPIGVVAFVGGTPVGWCSVAPRERYPALERSPTLRRVDDEPVWSVVCLYVAKTWRGLGVVEQLLQGAIAYVRAQGGTALEAYPHVRAPAGGPGAAYMGLLSTFLRTGFVEVARPTPQRRIVRYSWGSRAALGGPATPRGESRATSHSRLRTGGG